MGFTDPSPAERDAARKEAEGRIDKAIERANDRERAQMDFGAGSPQHRAAEQRMRDAQTADRARIDQMADRARQPYLEGGPKAISLEGVREQQAVERLVKELAATAKGYPDYGIDPRRGGPTPAPAFNYPDYGVDPRRGGPATPSAPYDPRSQYPGGVSPPLSGPGVSADLRLSPDWDKRPDWATAPDRGDRKPDVSESKPLPKVKVDEEPKLPPSEEPKPDVAPEEDYFGVWDPYLGVTVRKPKPLKLPPIQPFKG